MQPPRLSETLEIVVKSLYGAVLAGEPPVWPTAVDAC